MRLIRLLILGAGAAYAYKRFIADAGAGQAETEAAEPFSTENLPGDSPIQEAPASTAPASAEEPPSDPLSRPSWLDPADAS